MENINRDQFINRLRTGLQVGQLTESEIDGYVARFENLLNKAGDDGAVKMIEGFGPPEDVASNILKGRSKDASASSNAQSETQAAAKVPVAEKAIPMPTPPIREHPAKKEQRAKVSKPSQHADDRPKPISFADLGKHVTPMTESGAHKFKVILLLWSVPLLLGAILLALFFGLIFAAVGALAALFVVGIVALVTAAVVAGVVALVVGVIEIITVTGATYVGLLEIGIALFVCGFAMTFSVLMYNFIVKVIPILFGYAVKFFKLVIFKIILQILLVRENCNKA